MPVREGASRALQHNPDMITCTETGQRLSPKDTVYAATRIGDPVAVPLSEEILKRIPQEWRMTLMHRYKTGGINIHQAMIVGENGTSELQVNRDDGFLFSVPGYKFRKLLPETAEHFRFPESQTK